MHKPYPTAGIGKPAISPTDLRPQSVLDTRQLLAFVLVGRTLSFTQAGKELFVTQSAVSHAVKALEEEVGQRLLDRNGNKLRVTPAGEHLLHYAEKMLGLMSQARLALAQRERWQTNQLRLVAEETFCACQLPPLLKAFRRQSPDGRISVKTADTHTSIEWLSQNQADMAICIAPSRAEAVENLPLFSDELVWIVSPKHSWAASGIVSLEEIPLQTYICTTASSYTSLMLKNHLEREGIRFQDEQEAGTLETVKELVADNAGVTALAAWAVQEELRNHSLVALPLGKRRLRRNWSLLRPLDRRSDLTAETFSKLLIESLALTHPAQVRATS